MSQKDFVTEEVLIEVLKTGGPFIDVRAPVEFQSGSAPNSTNLPILNDHERALVGTTYKLEGQSAAIRLGEQLVSGDVKASRVEQWRAFLKKNPNALLYCFRGGDRSKYAQNWIRESGISILRVAGGYKRIRNLLIEHGQELTKKANLLVVCGSTGSGKTILIREFSDKNAGIDLEALANHRGSSFGAMPEPQPTQADFENRLFAKLLLLGTLRFSIEDESRTIGRVCLPQPLFEKMKTSQAVIIRDSVEVRAERILKEYVPDFTSKIHFDLYIKALDRIEKKLGGFKTKIIRDLIKSAYLEKGDTASHLVWIRELLVNYYDPLYEKSIENRPNVIFEGSFEQVREFMIANLK